MKIVQGQLFATPVWAVQLDEAGPLNRALMESIRSMRANDPTGSSRTNTLGWQSRPELQDRDEFSDFIGRSLDIVRQIGQRVLFRPGVRLSIEAWANISHPGSYNVVHNHPNCHISGVYYISTPPGCGDLFFRDPRSAARISVPPVDDASAFAQKDLAMQAREGTMYLFPSWLDHGVEPNGSDSDRVSIAFNVAVTSG